MPFLENAIELDTYQMSEYPFVKTIAERLFQELIERDPRRKKTDNEEYRTMETLKIILINLIIAHDMGVAVQYSRRKIKYNKEGRYGRIFFKYDRVIPIIDALIDMGYVEHNMGFYDRDKNYGRNSRMAATEKLIALFYDNEYYTIDYVGITPPDRDDLIQLRDDKGDAISIDDFEDKFRVRKDSMTDDLARYNDFISQHNVSFTLAQETEVNQVFLDRILKRKVNKGIVKINLFQSDGFISVESDGQKLHGYQLDGRRYLVMDGHGSDVVKKDLITQHKFIPSNYRTYYNTYINNNYNNYNHTTNHNNTDIQSIITPPMTGTNFDIYQDYQILDDKSTTTMKEELKKRPLTYYGIRELSFESKYQYLHRVFNIYPDNAGRFYGACHVNMPKEVRRCIVIDGEPSCELDYKAHHIRMLYHWKEIDYREDPYERLCDGDPSKRSIYKIVSLVGINAKTESTAVKGIRKELWDNGIPFDTTDKSIKACLNAFKEVHKPIANFLNSGKWGALQYYDSQITNIILMQMVRQGIPCLPVHDSYIVPASCEGSLYDVMMEAYRQVMFGFDPVIDKEF